MEPTFPKVYEWRQCDGTSAIDGCEDDNDLDDQTWENPYDVAKGHRGFLDGDYRHDDVRLGAQLELQHASATTTTTCTCGVRSTAARPGPPPRLPWAARASTYTEYYYGETHRRPGTRGMDLRRW